MANSLVEYQYLSNDMISVGIAETIVKESPILARMPFITVQGNSWKYNLESALAGANWYQVGDTWAESAPTWVQRTVSLCILGGDADVDKFAEQTLSNVQDLKTAVIQLKAKAIAHEFDRAFIYGGTTAAPKDNEFKGLLQMIAEVESASTTDLDAVNNSQVIAAHATSQALAVANLDELIDSVRPGKPDILVMSRRMRRAVNALAYASGTPLAVEKDQFGAFIEVYNGIPIVINDFIEDNLDDNSSSVCDISSYDATQTRADTKNNSPIFAVKFGEMDGVVGLTNGLIQTEDLGTLESKDATRTRIKFYVAAALKQVLGAAVLIGATDA